MPILSLRTGLSLRLLTCLFLCFFIAVTGFAQRSNTFLKGSVTDGLTHKTLSGVAVLNDSASKGSTSFADGHYVLSLGKGKHTIVYQFEGYQTKIISGVEIRAGEIAYLDVVLFPLSRGGSAALGSLGSQDSVFKTSYSGESGLNLYEQWKHANGSSDLIAASGIQPGTDKDGSLLLKRLGGVIVLDNPRNRGLQSLNVMGMGERYNQVLLNNAPLNSFDPNGRAYPLSSIPAEAIEEVSVKKTGDAGMPGDFSGGVVSIKTKDFPDQNFYYVQAGAGFGDATTGKDFYGDSRSKWEWLGFPGASRNLPEAVPTTRSRSSFDQLNPQEKVYVSRLLRNDLGPVKYDAKPDDKVTLGFGKIFTLKKGEKIGIIAFASHQHSERFDEATVQVAPDVAGSPFPFDVGKPLMKALASDLNYRYASQLTGMVNGSITFRRNKISLRSFFGTQFNNTYTQRSSMSKPDEDTLAHSGVNYLTEHRRFFNIQLAGEHALGGNGRFKMNWQATYIYYGQQNPDERNFLLRQDSLNGNTYEIATPSARLNRGDANTIDPSFPNSGRLWRDLKDHNFTGAVNILAPFNLFNRPQVISGGIYVQTRYRILNSDFFLTRGPGYSSLDNLLSPDRYYPGGLVIENFYINGRSPLAATNSSYIDGTNRANYTASANLGAAYIRFENRITRFLHLNWGFRLETNSQLVSSIRYIYNTGFKYPQTTSIDENSRVSSTIVLPSVTLTYHPVSKIRIHASYFKTINRQELQELTNYRYYDALSFMMKTGNPVLQNSRTNNYDAGVSFQPKAGLDFFLSGFYKKMNQPIEYILMNYGSAQGNLFSVPFNMPPTDIKGLTADLKINFGFISASLPWLSHLSFFANGSWLKSKVSAGFIRSPVLPRVAEHSLSGSPDYTVNTGLVLQAPGLPMITVLYNRTGDYITASGSGTEYKLSSNKSVLAIPDYRVKGRDQLDIQISQKLLRSRLQIIAGINNLLDNDYVEYQDLNGNKKFDAPLNLVLNGHAGFFQGGVDNTVMRINQQRTYYLTISYLFNKR